MRNLGNCISSNFSGPATDKECFHQKTVIGTLEIGSEALPRNCFSGNGSKYRRQKTLPRINNSLDENGSRERN